jgi:hypothetical protein
MPRWSSVRRTPAPCSTLVERRPQPDTRALTAPEVHRARLELAHDLLTLALKDGQELPAPVQATLQGLSTALGEVLRQARRLA